MARLPHNRPRRIGGVNGDPIHAVDTLLLLLLLKGSRNIAARMAAAGYTEDEARGAWNYAR